MKKNNENTCILLIGNTLFEDVEFIATLEKAFTVIKKVNLKDIDEIMKRLQVSVVVFESNNTNVFNLEIIKSLSLNFPNIPIIFLNGEREHIIKAFEYGAKDFFRVPLIKELLIERIQVLSTSQ